MLATGVSFAEQGIRRGRYPGQPKYGVTDLLPHHAWWWRTADQEGSSCSWGLAWSVDVLGLLGAGPVRPGWLTGAGTLLAAAAYLVTEYEDRSKAPGTGRLTVLESATGDDGG